MRFHGVSSATRLLAIVLAVSLATGAEVPRVQDRDREVLEASIDFLMDVKNEENKDLAFDRDYLDRTRIVVDNTTVGDRDPLFETALKVAGEAKSLYRKEVGAAWSQRNSEPSVPTAAFRFRDRRVVIDDLDALAERAGGGLSFDLAFRKNHPKARCWVKVSLPGYSRDGSTAVVLFRIGPDPHGAAWLYQLARFQGRWNVAWRRFVYNE